MNYNWHKKQKDKQQKHNVTLQIIQDLNKNIVYIKEV